MGSGHAHRTTGNERALWWAFGLTGSFLIAEVVGGLLSGSLALISDAAHMFTDTAGLAIALAAIRIGKRPADGRRTFGYYRFEILAATFNAVLLLLVAFYILIEAYGRRQQPPASAAQASDRLSGSESAANRVHSETSDDSQTDRLDRTARNEHSRERHEVRHDERRDRSRAHHDESRERSDRR